MLCTGYTSEAKAGVGDTNHPAPNTPPPGGCSLRSQRATLPTRGGMHPSNSLQCTTTLEIKKTYRGYPEST